MNDFLVTKDGRVLLDGEEIKGVIGFRVVVDAGNDPEVQLRVAVNSVTIDGYSDVFKEKERPT